MCCTPQLEADSKNWPLEGALNDFLGPEAERVSDLVSNLVGICAAADVAARCSVLEEVALSTRCSNESEGDDDH